MKKLFIATLCLANVSYAQALEIETNLISYVLKGFSFKINFDSGLDFRLVTELTRYDRPGFLESNDDFNSEVFSFYFGGEYDQLPIENVYVGTGLSMYKLNIEDKLSNRSREFETAEFKLYGGYVYKLPHNLSLKGQLGISYNFGDDTYQVNSRNYETTHFNPEAGLYLSYEL